jgi:hypothetical protein
LRADARAHAAGSGLSTRCGRSVCWVPWANAVPRDRTLLCQLVKYVSESRHALAQLVEIYFRNVIKTSIAVHARIVALRVLLDSNAISPKYAPRSKLARSSCLPLCSRRASHWPSSMTYTLSPRSPCRKMMLVVIIGRRDCYSYTSCAVVQQEKWAYFGPPRAARQ